MTDSFDQTLALSATALANLFANTPIRPTTLRLIWLLLLDLSLPPAVIVDFGVNSTAHYAALQAVVNADESGSLVDIGKVLDQALGNGPALTALVQKYAPQFKGVSFETDWDIIKR